MGLAKKSDKRAGHLDFINEGIAFGRKTHSFAVKNPSAYLGAVKWHAPWRRYVFYPHQYTLFDHVCMRQIADFCFEKTKEHDDAIKRARNKK